MYKAKETRSGRIVSAEEASPYGNFHCPKCNKPVFLRRGDVRAAHFAHRFASPECELYVHSDEIADPSPLHGRHSVGDERLVEKIAPLALSIALEPEDQKYPRKLRQWKLCITIPKSAGPHGQISFDSGGGVRRKVPLSTLAFSAHTHPVDLDAVDYGAVWTSPEVPQSYRDVVMHRLPGLSRDRITAFATTMQKYKPRVETLSLAASYYFVWRDVPGLALPGELPRRELAGRGEWKCALVSIPDEGESRLAEWLARATGLNLVPEKRRWSLLYPPAHDIDIVGRIQITHSNAIYVGLAIDGDEATSLECRMHGETTDTTIRDKAHRFVEIDLDRSSAPAVISLTWDGYVLPELVTAPWSGARRPSVRIQFLSPRTPPSHSSLHQAACRSALANVRASDSEIAAITLPAGLRGELRWRSAGEPDLHSLVLTATSMPSGRTDASLPHALIAAINLRLKDRGSDAWIDFGAFGSFHSSAEITSAPTAVQFALRRITRDRLIWFCKTSGAGQASNGQMLRQLGDRDLVRHFSTNLLFFSEN
jgi:hypothetical protein